jgi:uncharacterized protein YjiS (DUF1127 family)
MEQVLSYNVGQAACGSAVRSPNGWLALLATWYQRHTQRYELGQLDDRLLADIGLSREQAVAEARKPFWVA